MHELYIIICKMKNEKQNKKIGIWTPTDLQSMN